MVHNEIHAIDLGIIAAYLIAMVVIGGVSSGWCFIWKRR